MADETDLKKSLSYNMSDFNDQEEFMYFTDIGTIHENPEQFVDKFYEIEGVVSLVFSQKDQFILSDISSCPVCVYAKSSSNSILVSYLGRLPEKKENVRVYGFLTRDNKDQLQFNATEVKSQR